MGELLRTMRYELKTDEVRGDKASWTSLQDCRKNLFSLQLKICNTWLRQS